MRLPSIQLVAQQAASAFVRFPMVIISAAVAVGYAIYLVEMDNKLDNVFPFINVLLCGYLGVPLFLAFQSFYERYQYPSKKWVLNLAWLVLLVMVYFYLPDNDETTNVRVPYIRYTVFALCAHLLVAFAPFTSKNEINGFWQYNKGIFLRFLLSVLYAGFFYVGICFALFAIHELFGVDFDDELFFELFIVIAGIFNTWFFIAGFPQQVSTLEEDHQYPKGLKTFVQFVLLPLLLAYFLILYAYTTKVVYLWDWPKGIISYLIIIVAVLGILAMLLAYPYARERLSSALSFLARYYYAVMLPLVIVLFMAVGIRVEEYGVTVNRYLIIITGIWLTLVSVYFIAGGKNIKLIPMTLFGFVFASSFGPWGMFSIGENSQSGRLKDLLESRGILKEGKVMNEPKWLASDSTDLTFHEENQNMSAVDVADLKEIKSMLDYLEDYHGMSSIASWFEQDGLVIAQERKSSEVEVFMRMLGLEYQYYYSTDENRYLSFSVADPMFIETRDFDYIVSFSVGEDQSDSIRLPNEDYLAWAHAGNDFRIFVPGAEKPVEVDMMNLVEQLMKQYTNDYNSVKWEDIKIELTGAPVSVQFSNLNVEVINDTTSVSYLEGYLLFNIH
ncbi:MAG: DUF4153 domain-containing protein [Cyclobacteriaceae bacterium]|nr:DUF4153 domain-containing protein [Cyclobacteriaceae bacterium HetDA_MAG_MS6]